jgi:hypothetical protein
MKRFLLSALVLCGTTSAFAQQPGTPSKGTPDPVYGSAQVQASAQVSYVPRVIQYIAQPQVQYVAQPQIQYVQTQVVAQPLIQTVAVQHCAVAVNQCAVVNSCNQQAVFQGRQRNSKVVTKTVTKVRGGGLLSRIF